MGFLNFSNRDQQTVGGSIDQTSILYGRELVFLSEFLISKSYTSNGGIMLTDPLHSIFVGTHGVYNLSGTYYRPKNDYVLGIVSNNAYLYSFKYDELFIIDTYGQPTDVSYNSKEKIFGFVDYGGRVYLLYLDDFYDHVFEYEMRRVNYDFENYYSFMDEYHDLTNEAKIIETGYYAKTIKMVDDGFMLCNDVNGNCAFFDYYGYKLWEVEVGGDIIKRPAYWHGYWFIPDVSNNRVLVVDSHGKILGSIDFGIFSSVYHVDVCERYLAIATEYYLYVFELPRPKDFIEEKGGKPLRIKWENKELNYSSEITFTHDCRYLIVGETRGQDVKVFDNTKGELVDKKSYNDEVLSVATWREDYESNSSIVAVGLANGYVYIYLF